MREIDSADASTSLLLAGLDYLSTNFEIISDRSRLLFCAKSDFKCSTYQGPS